MARRIVTLLAASLLLVVALPLDAAAQQGPPEDPGQGQGCPPEGAPPQNPPPDAPPVDPPPPNRHDRNCPPYSGNQAFVAASPASVRQGESFEITGDGCGSEQDVSVFFDRQEIGQTQSGNGTGPFGGVEHSSDRPGNHQLAAWCLGRWITGNVNVQSAAVKGKNVSAVSRITDSSGLVLLLAAGLVLVAFVPLARRRVRSRS